jgi:hypothetical protein
MRRKVLPYFIASLLTLPYLLWLHREEQLAPHHIRRTYCGRVLDDFYTTNPEYVVMTSFTNVTMSGFVVTHMPVTNYWWHTWGIFK